MVEFAGWEMPVQYPAGVIAEHQAVRERAGLFDIGHMGQFGIRGPDALEFLQWATTNDVGRLSVGAAQYSLLCLPTGGAIDDILVYRIGDAEFFMVVNAANADRDWAWLEAQLETEAPRHRRVRPAEVVLERVSLHRTLLALQGPRAVAILQRLCEPDPAQLPSYHCMQGRAAGVEALVARTGYTGEDGVELSFPAMSAARVWAALLDAGRDAELQPAGLGARDTLRTEAGMALYGHELTEDTNPLEAGLGRVVRFEKGEFCGRPALARVQAEGVRRRLVGLELAERAIPRAGYTVLDGERPVGQVTSGGFAPTLKKGIAMAYVPVQLSDRGVELAVDIRGRAHAARVAPLPFYRRPKKMPKSNR